MMQQYLIYFGIGMTILLIIILLIIIFAASFTYGLFDAWYISIRDKYYISRIRDDAEHSAIKINEIYNKWVSHRYELNELIVMLKDRKKLEDWIYKFKILENKINLLEERINTLELNNEN